RHDLAQCQAEAGDLGQERVANCVADEDRQPPQAFRLGLQHEVLALERHDQAAHADAQVAIDARMSDSAGRAACSSNMSTKTGEIAEVGGVLLPQRSVEQKQARGGTAWT